MARYPKPDDQRVSRHRRLEWTTLPEHREGPPPALPPWREWRPETVAWWAELWTRPQAVMWEQDGSSLFVLAVLRDDVFAGKTSAWRFEEIRAHEDRHGLNPKAMLALRWRLPLPDDATVETPAKRATSAQRRKRLKLVDSTSGESGTI